MQFFAGRFTGRNVNYITGRNVNLLRLYFTIDFCETKVHSRDDRGGTGTLKPWRAGMARAVAKMIDDLRERGGLKGTDVANIAAVSPATVSRWTAGKASPHPKTQLIISDLRYVVDRLSEFYSPEETRLWLYSKHRLLDGERAIDLINRGHADKVLAVIESLDEGTFT